MLSEKFEMMYIEFNAKENYTNCKTLQKNCNFVTNNLFAFKIN